MPGEVETSAVLEFYKDANIFLTGGTGFMGKVLMEKLLRVCPNIGHIYMLVRMKKGKDPQSRLKELFDDPLFKKLKEERPDFTKKITCIPGDIGSLRLNMSDSDYDFLTNEITHVIHSAATVRFNEHLKTAININVRGTREVLEFCKKCSRIKVFVYVSTAYANCVRLDVDEVFYDPPLSPENAISLVEALSEEKLQSITPELIKPWPNTYCYTKAIAENVVREKAKTFPTLVFRPSVVIGTMREPIEGWIDNFYGPTGIIIAVGLGLMRVYYGSTATVANVVPVDLAINTLITSSWEVATSGKILTEKESDKVIEMEPKIYNFGVDSSNHMDWQGFLNKSMIYGHCYPSSKALWYYTLTITNVRIWYLCLIFFIHFIPGAISDGVLVLLGKKPQMLKAYRKIHEFGELLHYFATHNWTFHDYNRKKLWSRLEEKDKELFNFEVWNIDWDTYMKSIIEGIRTYVLKETEDVLPAARRRLFMFWVAHRFLQFCLIMICLWILSKYLFTPDNFKSHYKDFLLPSDTLRNST